MNLNKYIIYLKYFRMHAMVFHAWKSRNKMLCDNADKNSMTQEK